MRKSPQVVGREIAGETVLLDLDSGKYVVLNETGAFIWSLLGSESAAEIHARLTERFAVDGETAAAAFETFHAQLQAEGLLCDA